MQKTKQNKQKNWIPNKKNPMSESISFGREFVTLGQKKEQMSRAAGLMSTASTAALTSGDQSADVDGAWVEN